MNNEKRRYVIGFIVQDGWPMWIGYCPRSYDDNEVVDVVIGEGRVGYGATLSPKEMLEFIYGQTISEVINGKKVTTSYEEPPGWFERKCREAKCEWFIPMVKRMANGEKVPLEEITSTYFTHNGKPIVSFPFNKHYTRL